MIYLKKWCNIFEQNDSNEEDIKDFCEINLAYLLDEGMAIHVDRFTRLLPHTTYFDVGLSFRKFGKDRFENGVTSSGFRYYTTWIEVKDQIIPFLTRLRNEYQLIDKTGSDIEQKAKRYELEIDIVPEGKVGAAIVYLFTLDELIDEKVIIPKGKLNYISFKIKDSL